MYGHVYEDKNLDQFVGILPKHISIYVEENYFIQLDSIKEILETFEASSIVSFNDIKVKITFYSNLELLEILSKKAKKVTIIVERWNFLNKIQYPANFQSETDYLTIIALKDPLLSQMVNMFKNIKSLDIMGFIA